MFLPGTISTVAATGMQQAPTAIPRWKRRFRNSAGSCLRTWLNLNQFIREKTIPESEITRNRPYYSRPVGMGPWPVISDFLVYPFPERLPGEPTVGSVYRSHGNDGRHGDEI